MSSVIYFFLALWAAFALLLWFVLWASLCVGAWMERRRCEQIFNAGMSGDTSRFIPLGERGSTPRPATNLPKPQCSSGATQSGRHSARAVKVMESAGHHAKQAENAGAAADGLGKEQNPFRTGPRGFIGGGTEGGKTQQRLVKPYVGAAVRRADAGRSIERPETLPTNLKTKFPSGTLAMPLNNSPARSKPTHGD